MATTPTTDEIGDAWSGRPEEGYVRCHAPRYATLLRILHRVTATREVDRILDVGRAAFTELAYAELGLPVDTLGFGPDATTPTGLHHRFDLNDAAEPASWRSDLPRYPVVVLAEVIEHLHTSPSQVLPFLRSLLEPRGILIVQTPNAVAAHKRIKMLLGSNPFEPLREDRTNPGHFRELTMDELTGYVRASGLRVLRASAESYFDYRYVRHGDGGTNEPKHMYQVVNWVYAALPPSLKPGLTVVAERIPSCG